VLRTVCVVLLLALGGCSSATGGLRGDDGKDAETVSTKPPALGACRVLAPRDIDRPSNDTEPVACSSKHTAQTYAVGTFPAALVDKGMDSPALGGYVYDRCHSRFQRFLGGDESLVLRSTLTWAWFRSSADAWKAGSHTWRCDVVGGGDQSKEFVTLPATAKGLLLGKPDDRWLVCVNGPTVTGSVKIPCSDKHTWRAVTTVVLGKKQAAYPGDRLSEVRTRDYCSGSVGAWMNYPVDYDYGYTWFHEAEWKAGNRRSICWAKTDQ
jgi:hypothetical protein